MQDHKGIVLKSKPFSLQIGSANIIGEQTEGGKPAIVFLHAGLADRRMWYPQLKEIQDDYTAVAYDRRGFGETTCKDEEFLHLEDLKLILDHLEIEKATIVGCSNGGGIGLDFYMRYPEYVENLVLIAPAIGGAPELSEFPPEVIQVWEQLDTAYENEDLNLINKLMTRLWIDGPFCEEGRVAPPKRDLFLDMNAIAIAHPRLELEKYPPPAYDKLGEIQCPVLLVWGNHDLPHLIERCVNAAQLIPNSRTQEIKGTAHVPNLEKPEEFNAILRDFLAQ